MKRRTVEEKNELMEDRDTQTKVHASIPENNDRLVHASSPDSPENNYRLVHASSPENNYGLVCQGICNTFDTCYLSVALQCILAMETTRKAFMRLPTPGSPQYCIPEKSMTALIYSLFLERQQTHKKLTLQNPNASDGNIAAVIVKWLEQRFSALIAPLGYGGDAACALHLILEIIIEEGYVTGIEEDLCGTYRSRVTCRNCGAHCEQVDSDIVVTFWVDKCRKFDLLGYLTEGIFEDKDMADGNIRFLTAHHLFNFIERVGTFKAQIIHDSEARRFQQDSCDEVYHVRYRTTICNFPHTLILDLPDVGRWEKMMLHLEFLDLSHQMEPQCSSGGARNCKYKLVVVEAVVENREHSITYVTASKYVNRNVTENMWYEINDHEIKLVPFTELFKPTDLSLILIYEQMNACELVSSH